MKNNLLLCSLVVFLVAGSLVGEMAFAKEGENTFVYSQEKLNRVEEKNVKYKVAIGSFGESVDISGSPFNKIMENKDDNAKTYNVNIASPNLEKPRESKINVVVGLLSDILKKTEKFEVIERQEVNQLIREIQFERSDWVKKDSANKLGNIFSVQYILLGEVLPNYRGERIGKNQYTATLRLVDVKTGVVVSTGTGQKNILQEALAQAVRVLSDNLEGDPWVCRVVRLDDKGVYINAGFDDKIKKNDVFSIVRLGDPIVDQTTNRILGNKQTEIAKIKIIEVLEKDLSLAKSLNSVASIKEGDIVSAKRVILKKDSEEHLWKNIFEHTPDQQ